MAHYHIPSEIPARYLPRSRAARVVVVLMILVGLASFLFLLTRDPGRAWRAYVSNWLYFTSVAQGAVMLAVVTTVAKAKWNWSIRRVSLGFAAFLPLSFLLFLPMLVLGEGYFPWIGEMAHDPVLQKKAAYLNLPFLISRDLVGLLALFAASLFFAYLALRPDMGPAGAGPGRDPVRERWRERLSQSWAGREAEKALSHARLRRLAPALALLYAVVMSMIAYDWVMSLEPHWYSTLFGGWFFMGAFWGGLAATAVSMVRFKAVDEEVDRLIGEGALHDIGKLTFAFGVFWTYLFWSQYLVIWYGKLPWEQSWIIHRMQDGWGQLSVLVIVLCFVVPFAGLIGRAAKMRPRVLASFATTILVGLWLERYVMVGPPLHTGGPVISFWEPLIGVGFLGLLMGSLHWFFATFPVIQMWQPPVEPEMLEAEVGQEAVEAGGLG